MPARGGIELRDWWLLLTLPLVYWTPGPLAGDPNLRLERWLLRVDEMLGGGPFAGAAAPAARDWCYLLFSPVVPAGSSP